MESNVIEFPTRAVREWTVLERSFRDVLARSGASPEMMEEVCGRMKEYWKKSDVKISLPIQIPAGLPEWARKAIDDSFQKLTKSLADQLHVYTGDLMLDRLRLEVDLYNLRHEEPEKA
jgi:hypothetical protein